ncbi:hypothetical protein [Aeribacillus composti]|nr:hypothetical protein [Aeribacillus composti]
MAVKKGEVSKRKLFQMPEELFTEIRFSKYQKERICCKNRLNASFILL